MTGFLLLFKNEYYSSPCIYHIFFIHSLVDGYLGGFLSWLLWIVLQWTWESRYFFQIHILMNYFGNISRSGVVWSFDSSMFNFFFWVLCILLSIAATIYISSTGTIVHCWLKFDLHKGAMLNLAFSLSLNTVCQQILSFLSGHLSPTPSLHLQTKVPTSYAIIFSQVYPISFPFSQLSPPLFSNSRPSCLDWGILWLTE